MVHSLGISNGHLQQSQRGICEEEGQDSAMWDAQAAHSPLLSNLLCSQGTQQDTDGATVPPTVHQMNKHGIWVRPLACLLWHLFRIKSSRHPARSVSWGRVPHAHSVVGLSPAHDFCQMSWSLSLPSLQLLSVVYCQIKQKCHQNNP